ncbi:peroxiredoxin, Ohr subfamily [Chryseolinea serpens]|uniref:Peroxiredoxin, Ohr subfamily n=1 Tax=Chryseolinea serpens TaxID=947013 RepID=A0A1M5QZ19_9BACT|nr:Ohr family peroxiredoxin [Chryseolinea serpens]SHH19427.1 peroxiredoxin, Ohr subfamily [Chryseolinea serpens]
MKTIYTAQVTATGGRHGRITSSDNILQHDLALVDGLGKPDHKVGTNPEQLFAAAYAACFETSLRAVADHLNIRVTESFVEAFVSLQKDNDGFHLGVSLHVRLPGVDHAIAQAVMKKAHEVCPYSRAIRNNVVVEMKLIQGE